MMRFASGPLIGCFLTLCVLLICATPVLAGKGAFLPTYHAPPCSGAECRGDDPRSGLPCQGFLCSITSAGGLQPPITAARAAEMEKARAEAAEAAASSAAAPIKPAALSSQKSKAKKRTSPRATSRARKPMSARSSPAAQTIGSTPEK